MLLLLAIDSPHGISSDGITHQRHLLVFPDCGGIMSMISPIWARFPAATHLFLDTIVGNALAYHRKVPELMGLS